MACGCSMKTFATFWTVITTLAYSILLCFIYRDYSDSTADTALHVTSIICAVIGAVLLGIAVRSWLLNSYDSWQGAVIAVFGTSFLVAFFEVNVIMMGVTFGAWVSSVLIMACSSDPETYVVPEATPILQVVTVYA